MRPIAVVSLLVALLVPAAAYAARTAPGDGTLSVRNGEGIINLNVRGVIIGRFDSGQLSVDVPKDGDCDALDVWGASRTRESVDELGVVFRCHFIGRNVRFRFVGGQHVIKIGRVLTPARDVDLSVVGRGFAFLKGSTSVLDGVYSPNGEPFQSMPDEGKGLTIGAPTAPGG